MRLADPAASGGKDTTLNVLAVLAINDLMRKNGKRAPVTDPLFIDED